jgi:hypothetical protein
MAGTSKAERTDAVVTLKMQTDLAHRWESMYGYRGTLRTRSPAEFINDPLSVSDLRAEPPENIDHGYGREVFIR